MKTLKIVAKVTICSYEELHITEKNLICAAKNAAKDAYAPYSKFQVGCAVLLEDGTVVTGNNQENIAYPAGLCAERTAIFSANANFPDLTPVSIAVAAWTAGSYTDRFVTPCGTCRQVLAETEQRYKKPIKMFLYGEQEICVVNSIQDVLPLCFQKE